MVGACIGLTGAFVGVVTVRTSRGFWSVVHPVIMSLIAVGIVAVGFFSPPCLSASGTSGS
jgi:hypothetical protein